MQVGLKCAARGSLEMQDPKTRHLGTTAQLCRAISPHMSSQYGELRPTNGKDLFGSLGHSSKFQRHLDLAGRPSRWALAHILVYTINANAGINILSI